MIKVTKAQYEEAKMWANEDYCIEAVKIEGYALQFVTKQTEAICRAAIGQTINALRYVDIKFLEVQD